MFRVRSSLSAGGDSAARPIQRRPAGLAVGIPVVALMILLAVVGGAAEHGAGTAQLRRGPASILLSVLMTLSGFAGVASLMLLFWALVTRNRRSLDGSAPKRHSPVLVTGVLLAIFACFTALLALAARKRYVQPLLGLTGRPDIRSAAAGHPLPFNTAASFATSSIVIAIVAIVALVRIARSMGWKRVLRGLHSPLASSETDREEAARPTDLGTLSLQLAAVSVADPTAEPDPRAGRDLLLSADAGGRRPRRPPARCGGNSDRVPAANAGDDRNRGRARNYSHRPVRGGPLQPASCRRVDALRRHRCPRRPAQRPPGGSRRLTRVIWATFATLAVLVAIALGIALGVGAPDPAAIERAAAAAFGLLGLGAGSIAVSSAVGVGQQSSRRPRLLDAEAADAGTANLVALERSLRFGASTAGDFHAHVAAQARRSRQVAARPSRCLAVRAGPSRRTSRPDGYALVDPSGSPPADRFEPGVAIERVDSLVDRLEALGAKR